MHCFENMESIVVSNKYILILTGNKHNSVCFDYGNAQIIVDDDRLEELDITPLSSGRIMNTPYIDISIEGRRARVFVDTGAPISVYL